MAYSKRKRVSNGMPSWGRTAKRSKRTFRRKFKGGRIKSRGYTSQSAVGFSTGFRSRKISPSKWRKMLWDSTLQKSHYRSVFAVSSSIPTQLSNTASSVSFLNADDNGLSPFWETGGGAVDVDGGTVPVFTDDIILRGGIHRISVTNIETTVQNVRVTIFGVRSGSLFDPAGFPTSVPVSWDPTIFPEFKAKIGTVVCRKDFLLENGQSCEMFMRRKVQKIDRINSLAGRYRSFWIVQLTNLDGIIASVMSVVRSTNLSFSADAES